MADNKRIYPMVPAATWWKLRDKFSKTVPSTVTPNYLATVLSIAEKTAKNTIPPLRLMGLINDEGVPTERANHWRFDEDYPSVCKDIVDEIYPEELRHAVPEPDDDLEGAERWFKRDAAVGDAAARNMARFYQLLVDADPSKKPDSFATRTQRKAKDPVKKEATIEPPKPKDAKTQPDPQKGKDPQTVKKPAQSLPEIHIDVQIHIASDSSPEQIDKIFESMRKHLYDQVR